MPEPTQPPASATTPSPEETRFLNRRLRAGLGFILASTLLFPLLELFLPTASDAWVEVLALQSLVVVIVLLRLLRGESDAVGETLLAALALGLAIAGIGILRADLHTPLVLYTLVALVTATLFAWQAWAQAVVAVTFGAAAAFALAFTPDAAPVAFATLAAFGLGLAASVYIAFELSRTRRHIGAAARERARTAAALQLVESAVENANDAIVILTSELNFPGPRIVYVNPAFTAMTGYTADEAMRQPLRALFGPGTATIEISKLQEALRHDEPQIGQGKFHRKDGTPYMLEWHTASISEGNGRAAYRMTINRDITARVEAESGRAALLEVARSVGGQLDLSEIFARVQGRIAQLLPCERVLAVVWDADSQAFRFIAAHGFPEEHLQRLARLEHRPTESLRQQLLGGRTAVINEPVGQSLLPLAIFNDYGVRAVAITPLHARGRMLGALLVANASRAHRVDAAQVQLLEGIARQVALAWDAAELYRAQREDARVARALATAGEEMISSLSTPVLQQRLCALTTKVLDCAASHTLLWRPQERVYEIVDGAGDTPEQRESLRLLKISPSDVAGVAQRLRREEVVVIPSDPSATNPLGTLLHHYGLGASLFIALRRGEEIIGCQIAHAARADHVYSDVQLRIARGLGQLASMALENARLVEETERANRLKSEFVATMSHELRTPLNVVIGYNELLLDDAYGDLTEEQRAPLARADKSARELSDMIDAILDLNRLDKPVVPLHLQQIAVPEIVDEVIADDHNLREKPDLLVRREIEPGLPSIRSDRVKLKMIVKNLFGNAVKFTEAGSITVAVRAVHPGIEIRVDDTGIGIAPDAQSFIFDPFRQVDGSDTRRYGGLGLGLYIARRLVDVLGGTLTLESEVGSGSSFRVWIPLTPMFEVPDETEGAGELLAESVQ